MRSLQLWRPTYSRSRSRSRRNGIVPYMPLVCVAPICTITSKSSRQLRPRQMISVIAYVVSCRVNVFRLLQRTWDLGLRHVRRIRCCRRLVSRSRSRNYRPTTHEQCFYATSSASAARATSNRETSYPIAYFSPIFIQRSLFLP